MRPVPALTLLAFLLLPAAAAADSLVSVETGGGGSAGVAAGEGCTGVEVQDGPPTYRYFCYGVYTFPGGYACVGMFTYDRYHADCASAIPTVPDLGGVGVGLPSDQA